MYFLFNNIKQRELATTPRSFCKHGDRVSPPSSEIMPKHDEDMGGIGEKILVDSWGKCASI
jgi:hypothetical protein